jgi:hypothetical protein
MKPLDSCERSLLLLIGETDGKGVLGLLPVDPELQQKILLIVEACLAGNVGQWIELSDRYPATCCYAMVLALGSGAVVDPKTGRARFWEAIEHGLKLKIPQTSKRHVSETFKAVCRRLDLVQVEPDPEVQVDRYIQIILFHAGILPCWGQSLAEAIEHHLTKNPCPDLGSDDQMVHLAGELAKVVPPGVKRLPRTLLSSIGPLVCRMVIQAHESGDYSLLPHHLRDHIQRAFERIRVERSRGPFLRLDEGNQRLDLVLPSQSQRLLSNASFWEIGTRRFTPGREVVLDASSFGVEEIEVRLRGLAQGFQDQEYRVHLAPDGGEGFLVFRHPENRRVAVSAAGPVALIPGCYSILLRSVDGADGEGVFHPFGRSGSLQIARIEVHPGSKPFVFLVGDSERSIVPRICPEFLLQRSGGDRIGSLRDGEFIYFGDELDLSAYVPIRGAAASNGLGPMEFRISVEPPVAQDLTVSNQTTGLESGAFRSFDLTHNLLRPFLDRLPPGIHFVCVVGEGACRSFSRRFWFWKGLSYVSQVEGYVCIARPENLDASSCRGVVIGPRGVAVEPGFGGDELTLSVQGKGRMPPTVPRPGLWVVRTDMTRKTRSVLKLGETVEVTAEVPQRVTITSGDPAPWTIRCGTVVLGSVGPSQPRLFLDLEGLRGQFGPSATVSGSQEGLGAIELFSYASAKVARDLRLDEEAELPYSSLSFLVSDSEIAEVEVEAVSISEDPEVSVKQVLVIGSDQPQIGAVTFWPDGVATWEVLPEGESWRIRLRVNDEALPPGPHALRLRSRRNPESPWRPLRMVDRFGLSEGTLHIDGPLIPEPSTIWARFLESIRKAHFHHCFPDIRRLDLSAEDSLRCLSRLQAILMVKYPTPVWDRCQWLGSALVYFCQDLFSEGDAGVQSSFARVAVEGILARCRPDLSIQSFLVFGCQSRVMAIPGSRFPEEPLDESLAGRVWAEIGRLGRSDRLVTYARSDEALGFEFWGHFENFHQVATRSMEVEFSNFRFQEFFKVVGQGSGTHVLDSEVTRLLSEGHLQSCLSQLVLRFAVFDHQIQDGDSRASEMGGLSLRAQEIQAVGNNLHLVLPELRSLLGLPAHFDFSIPLPLEDSPTRPLLQTISDALLAVAGLGRLCANDRIDRDRMKRSMRSLFGGDPGVAGRNTRIHRLCLLLSLAPELFAFHMLFWDLVLKPAHRP